MTTRPTDPLYKKQGRRYVQAESPFSEWDGFMAISAVRYCHGRASYAPSAAMDWCRDNWHHLSDKARHVIVRDTIDWLADRAHWDEGKGMTMQDYRDDWQRFALERLEAGGEDFARRTVRAALYCPEKCKGAEVRPFLKWLEHTDKKESA